MKNKSFLKLLFVALTVMGLVAGSTSCLNRQLEVRIPVTRGEAVDLEAYDHIVYADVEILSPPKNYSPDEKVQVFFLAELPKLLGRDFIHCKNLDEGKKIAAEKPNAVLITGKLIFDIKERNKIEDVKNKKTGKKERKFVKVAHWTLKLEMVMTAGKDGEVIFKKTYKEKISDAEKDDKYNFESLFFRVHEQLTRDVTRVKRMVRRFLLK